MNDLMCRICAQPIVLRQPLPGMQSTYLGYWQHLLTDEGIQAEKDHDATR